MWRDWLEEHQIAFYFAAVMAAAIAGLSSAQFTGLTAMAITPAIAVLMYAMFLQIPFLELREAFANRRFVGALLLANFLLVPLMVWLVTWPLSSNKALLVGALLVLLTPCIDYVVVFTHLGRGDSRLVLAATPLLLLLQLLLLPLFAANPWPRSRHSDRAVALRRSLPVTDRPTLGSGCAHRIWRTPISAASRMERRLGLAASACNGPGSNRGGGFADRGCRVPTRHPGAVASGIRSVSTARSGSRRTQLPAIWLGGFCRTGSGL